jgi:hypothetical protein
MLLIFSVGMILLFAAVVGVSQMFRSGRPHWQVDVPSTRGSLTFVLRDTHNTRHKIVVFEGHPAPSIAARSYRLPDDLKDIEGATLAFRDATVLPGRLRFTFLGHTFDLMEAGLLVDGVSHSWNDGEVIKLQTPNQAMQLTTSKPAIYAGGVCHRERMLRGMHIGLAAADLVSR